MFRTSVAAKTVMAATALMLFGFVVGHLLGNLQIFLGPGALNAYALSLRDHLGLLWAARVVLLAALVLHVATAVHLTRKNRMARPDRYVLQRYPHSDVAARAMLLTGWLILAFVLFHLAHYTFCWIHPEYAALEWTAPDGRRGHDVYTMTVLGFQSPLIVLIYIAAQVVLAMHLSHGLSSVVQTFGFKTHRNERAVNKIGPVLAGAIFVGFVSIPISVLLGFVTTRSP